jgi:hypothetical protein
LESWGAQVRQSLNWSHVVVDVAGIGKLGCSGELVNYVVQLHSCVPTAMFNFVIYRTADSIMRRFAG